MPAPDAIVELVRQFGLHRDQYRNGAFSEVAARHQFIDPFFAALGWDVNNAQGFAEQYKEVVHEDKVKVAGRDEGARLLFLHRQGAQVLRRGKKSAVDISHRVERRFAHEAPHLQPLPILRYYTAYYEVNANAQMATRGGR